MVFTLVRKASKKKVFMAGNWRETARGKGQSFDSPNKSPEAPLARPSRAVLACTRKQAD